MNIFIKKIPYLCLYIYYKNILSEMGKMINGKNSKWEKCETGN